MAAFFSVANRDSSFMPLVCNSLIWTPTTGHLVSRKMAAADRRALVALFRSTKGSGWKRKHKWDTESALSLWHGVEVNEEGRVVALNLSKNNLDGA